MPSPIKYMSINSVVAETPWSDGLKNSMISDFVSSGYGNVAPLIGASPSETSANIQKNIIGFSSDKNTYLQANNLAQIIHKNIDKPQTRKYVKRSAPKADYPIGEVLQDCGGWIVAKKTIPDGRVVYNAKIKPDTAPNKDDWQTIKNEIYLETTFKWGRFGAFEKWGQIASEAAVLQKLCAILSKYYKADEAPAKTTEEPKKEADAQTWADYIMQRNDFAWRELNIQSGGELKESEELQEKFRDKIAPFFKVLIEENIPQAIKLEIQDIISENNAHTLNNALALSGFYGSDIAAKYLMYYKKDPKLWLNPKYYGYSEEEKKIGLYINGEFIQNVESQEEAFEILKQEFGEAKLKSMMDNNQAQYIRSKNRVDLLRDTYEYGKKWGVDKIEGNQLQFAFIDKGYQVSVYAKTNALVIYKSGAKDGVIITDNGGEFTLDRYGYNENITSINYVKYDEPISPQTLASVIDDIATDFFKRQNQEESPKSEGTSKEDVEKAIKGLKYLADKGNENAIKAIKGLQYLLNK